MSNGFASVITAGDVRCVRMLSENGSVVVFKGQTTDPATQVAFRKVWSKHLMLNLVDQLNLAPDEPVRDYLTIDEGDFVSVGEMIAKRDGFRKQTITAKISGRFLGIYANQLIFETDPIDVETCYAGFPGVVTDVIPGRGAVIETSGSYVRGIWGNGKIGQGILLSVDMTRNDGIFGLDCISMDLAGTVVFANTCLDPAALKTAAKMNPGGLIFGSLPSSLLPLAQEMHFPIIITDWLGVGKISDPIHLALGENIIKFAYLYAAGPGAGVPSRPEIIIPQDEYIPESKNPSKSLVVGAQVRILEGFYGGELGIVTEVKQVSAESGDESEQVVVAIDESTVVTIPINNIEVIHVK
ncbi:MAG: hypothetical protein GX933_08535 [Chloroflexi bacterium]|nr:hypothetical protein [Chloroflexota bacterium]